MSSLSPPVSATEISPPAPPDKNRSPLLKSKMPGLDTLRGVAVLSVVTYHGLKWSLPPAGTATPGVQRLGVFASFGWLGVNLFFVISGFLITGILLDTRTRPNYWSSFYTRRILRIVPLYFLTLLVIRFSLGVTWTYILICVFYLANFAEQFHVQDGYGPLWSLGVEEQFYLFWPLLVRRLRQRRLALVCLISIVLSPLLRSLSTSGLVHLGNSYSTTWLITDNLATGAIFAILLRTRHATTRLISGLTWSLGISGMVLLLLGFRFQLLSRTTPAGAGFQPEPFLLLFSCMLLLALRFGDHPSILRLTGPLRLYGYISYGLYLFQKLGFSAYDTIASRFEPIAAQLTAPALLFRFMVVLASTTLLSYLLRRYFEEAFLLLKDRLVPYGSSKAQNPAAKPS